MIAFYLPQYHPIPENDLWWGKGFTEWTNVTRARPLFRGHEQPHLPADLGFYDLRVPEAREAQAELAWQYGIQGFCYYHYWFQGRKLLERPFDEVLHSGRPDFPFCLCWANENWTRRWDGKEREILVAQSYSEVDDRAHIQSLIPALLDRRYLRVDGRPLLLIYRASKLPDPIRTTSVWRDEARRHGVDGLYLCRVESFPVEGERPPGELGFDAGVEFTPRWHDLGPRLQWGRRWDWARRLRLAEPGFGRHSVYEYSEVAEKAMKRILPSYELFRCVTPGWDNSARRDSDGLVLLGSSPELYGAWLTRLITQATARPEGRRIVFVNAWNEWAEGNHLEPCQRWGRSYLEATRKSLLDSQPSALRLHGGTGG